MCVDTEGDMQKPTGFWVKQMFADGSEMAVRVLHPYTAGQAEPSIIIGLTSADPSRIVVDKP